MATPSQVAEVNVDSSLIRLQLIMSKISKLEVANTTFVHRSENC